MNKPNRRGAKPQHVHLNQRDSEAFADALATPKPPSDRLKKAAERSRRKP